MDQLITPEPKHPIEITDDLTTIKFLCREMTAALQKGLRSRERSLIITKLQEAAM